MSSKSRRPKWLTLLLVLAPLWFIVSAGFAIHHRIKSETIDDQRPRNRFSRSITIKEVGDDLQKITAWIGERHHVGDIPSKNLARTAAWIEGLLGPSNTGYVIVKKQGPLQWPILMTTLHGKDSDKAAVWIVSTYDCKAASNGIEANATGIVASIAAARALAGSEVNADIHFAFLPHFNHAEAPRTEMAAILKDLILENSPTKAVLCVDAMGAQSALQATSRDSALLESLPLHDLATAIDTDESRRGDDKDLASLLFDMSLPAVRIATRPPMTQDDRDDQMPAVATLAQSAMYLTELIKRCVNSR
ncbi:MAG: hypothetical protein RLZ22_1561 [Verrucomicrobiota bacterium]|jgi:hypothetical protein